MGLSPLDLILTTWRDLSGNWLRSGLTALGIFMGVAAVNATLNIDAISQAQIAEKLAARDKPFVSFWIYDPAGIKDSPELTAEDYITMEREISGIAGIGQRNEVFSARDVRYQGIVVADIDVRGVSLNFQDTTGRRILQGRFFQQADFDQYQPVAIINTELAQELFLNGESPIGPGIFLNTVRLTVVGVSETKQSRPDRDPEKEIWLTQNYASAIAGRYSWGRPQVAISELENYQSVQDDIEAFLKQRYPGFEVRIFGNAADLYKEEQQQRTSSLILKIVGVLALVVGGVGIANITVASVIERTREIGLRRAIGATDTEVMLQFIAEAVLLSLIGGTAAIATVHTLSKIATTQLFEAPYTFRYQDALVSMGAAFVVGVGASFLPALRVTQIDVVQALRGE
jgi:putative ABC transport system permease protein